jgi:cellulose synthase/poly-beta-1,6-N-acetylglucosamine synthase-like glycosyltransferase
MTLIQIIFYLYIGFLFLVALGLIILSSIRTRVNENSGKYDQTALVMVPCKGVDYSMRQNLQSLKEQNFRNYKLVGIVDSSDDPSVPYLKEAGIEIIVSEYPCMKCSGKVRALSTAISRYTDYHVYVIADSDITVGKQWLEGLMNPLSNPKYGAATTFPVFYPEGGFWSHFKSAWGIVGKSMMQSRITRFGWGGSLAFRKSLLDDPKNLSFFSESVSDDTAITKICKERGLEIFYSRDSEPVVKSPDNFSQMIEWSNRQTALSIAASPEVYRYGVMYYSLEILLILSSVVLSAIVSVFFLLFLIPELVKILKVAPDLKASGWRIPFLELILPFFYEYNLLKAHRMNEIIWRGNSYMLQKQKN